MSDAANSVRRQGLVPDHPADKPLRVAPRGAWKTSRPAVLPVQSGAAHPVPIPSKHNFQDLTGRDFGRWRVLFYVGARQQRPRWYCRCACGIHRSVMAMQLVNGSSKSCGCGQANYNRATRDAQVARIDRFLELVALLEEFVRLCEVCGGTGTIKERFECFPVIDGMRVQQAAAGAAIRRDPCTRCGGLRRAIARTQEIAA